MKRFEIKAVVDGRKVMFSVENNHLVMFSNREAWDTDAKAMLNLKSGRGYYCTTDLGVCDDAEPSNETITQYLAKWRDDVVVVFGGSSKSTGSKSTRSTTKVEPKATPQFVPPTTTQPQGAGAGGDGSMMGALGALFGGIKEEVKNEVLTVIAPYINSIQRVEHIITLPEGKKSKIDGVLHEQFDKVLKLVMMGKNVYLYGPAGTGKSEIAAQVAKAMKLDYYQQDKVEDMYEFIGVVDGHGKFHETELFKAWTQGGICCLDEYDGYLPTAVLKLNGALSQGVLVAGDGKAYKKHPDCHIIATGNTNGCGPSDEYTTRYPQDASALNRFIPIKIGYDPKIEKSCANNDVDLVDFIRQVRKVKSEKNIKLVVSYRNVTDMVDLEGAFDTKESVLVNVVNRLDEDTARLLLRGLPDYSENRWFKAAKQLASEI